MSVMSIDIAIAINIYEVVLGWGGMRLAKVR